MIESNHGSDCELLVSPSSFAFQKRKAVERAAATFCRTWLHFIKGQKHQSSDIYLVGLDFSISLKALETYWPYTTSCSLLTHADIHFFHTTGKESLRWPILLPTWRWRKHWRNRSSLHGAPQPEGGSSSTRRGAKRSQHLWNGRNRRPINASFACAGNTGDAMPRRWQGGRGFHSTEQSSMSLALLESCLYSCTMRQTKYGSFRSIEENYERVWHWDASYRETEEKGNWQKCVVLTVVRTRKRNRCDHPSAWWASAFFLSFRNSEISLFPEHTLQTNWKLSAFISMAFAFLWGWRRSRLPTVCFNIWPPNDSNWGARHEGEKVTASDKGPLIFWVSLRIYMSSCRWPQVLFFRNHLLAFL